MYGNAHGNLWSPVVTRSVTAQEIFIAQNDKEWMN